MSMLLVSTPKDLTSVPVNLDMLEMAKHAVVNILNVICIHVIIKTDVFTCDTAGWRELRWGTVGWGRGERRGTEASSTANDWCITGVSNSRFEELIKY